MNILETGHHLPGSRPGLLIKDAADRFHGIRKWRSTRQQFLNKRAPRDMLHTLGGFVSAILSTFARLSSTKDMGVIE